MFGSFTSSARVLAPHSKFGCFKAITVAQGDPFLVGRGVSRYTRSHPASSSYFLVQIVIHLHRLILLDMLVKKSLSGSLSLMLNKSGEFFVRFILLLRILRPSAFLAQLLISSNRIYKFIGSSTRNPHHLRKEAFSYLLCPLFSFSAKRY